MAAACAFDGRCVVAGGFDNDHETSSRCVVVHVSSCPLPAVA